MKQTSIHTPVEQLAGKRILLTGGTTGIGRAIGILLGSYGARIFTFGRHRAELNDALAAMRDAGGDAQGIVADVTKEKDVRMVFARAEKALSGLDILINNAALGGGGITDEKEWRYIVETNLLGYIACAKEAVERLKRRKRGHIVLVGSMSADVREAGSSIYVATKAGIQGFAEALRKEVNPLGIKVSLIEPGAVGTDMQEESPRQQRRLIRRKEMMRAEDIAVCVHYVLTQPKRCDVVAVQIRPHRQII